MNVETPESNVDPFKELISTAQEHLSAKDPATAVQILRPYAATYAKNEKFCFEFGYALYENGEHKEAAKYLKASIKLGPNVRPQKYFTLAQISDDPTAIQLHNTGLALATQLLGELSAQALTIEERAAQEKKLKRPMAQAYCALAHLEEKKLETNKHSQFSESLFLQHLSSAAAIYPFYLETYLLGAMYYYNCENEGLWRQAIGAMIGQLQAMELAGDEELDTYAFEFFIVLLRLMVECEMWPEVIALAEVAAANDGGNLEGIYLLAFCLFQEGRYADTEEVLDRLKELKIEESGDQELIEGYLELRAELEKKKPFENHEQPMAGEHQDEEWQSDDQDEAE